MSYEFIEGNEAIARGAIKAGCDFYASYPITPASSILNYMNDVLPLRGGIVLQAEDEIASMGFCLGASMSGRKVMTATSGPGLSLYSENVGLAIMIEAPIVIVNVQRQGPATGSATESAEGDIQFTQWVTSGGLPTITLSPADVGEAYLLTYIAFNFAEKYRTPVFVLTSKEIGITKETVDIESIELPERFDRIKYDGEPGEFKPHYFELPEDVPPIAHYGEKYIARYTTSTHDKAAYLTGNPEVIQQMIDHYIAKIENAVDNITIVKEDLVKGAEILVISYGVVSRSATLAVREARKKGRKVSSLIIKTLWPVPEKAIRKAMEGVKKVVIPEMNMGQYLHEIERLAPCGVEIKGVLKMNTTLISPDEIIRRGEML